VLLGVVLRLVLAFVLAMWFPLAVVPVPVVLVPTPGAAASSSSGHCNLPLGAPLLIRPQRESTTEAKNGFGDRYLLISNPRERGSPMKNRKREICTLKG
jgi:hypothetical protein